MTCASSTLAPTLVPSRAALFALIFPFLWTGAPGDAAAAPPAAKPVKTGRILLQSKPGLPEHRLEHILQRAGARARGKLRNLDVHVIEVPAQAELAVARALAGNPHIAFAEPDELAVLADTIPNDPNYSKAWHLPRIGAPAAWDMARGDGVVVAVLDTGIDPTHLDLVGQLVPGWNPVSQNTDTADIQGHGTQVAGVIAAQSNNGLGVASLAWRAKLMPVRITNRSDGYAYWSDVANGLTWAADRGAKIANISYAVCSSSTVLSAAQYLKNKGGITVVAAGNDNADTGCPADASLVVVAATDSKDARGSFSNYGRSIDLSAPGVGIYTTRKGGTYNNPSGTSFASPIVAGTAALVMGRNPKLAPDQVVSILLTTAKDLGAQGWDSYYGAGRVDTALAVQKASQVVAADTTPPQVTISSPAAASTVSGLQTVDVTAGDDVGVSRVDLLVNGTRIATDTEVPYQFSWDTLTVPDGKVTLTAQAYDAAGNRGTSPALTLAVSNAPKDTQPPTVRLLSPVSDTTVSGTVALAASAQDNVGVTELRITVDGALKCAGKTSVSCTWKVNNSTPAGAHTVVATARDAAGNSASAAASITVAAASKGKGK